MSEKAATCCSTGYTAKPRESSDVGPTDAEPISKPRDPGDKLGIVRVGLSRLEDPEMHRLFCVLVSTGVIWSILTVGTFFQVREVFREHHLPVSHTIVTMMTIAFPTAVCIVGFLGVLGFDWLLNKRARSNSSSA